jgi:hypothetical protein
LAPLIKLIGVISTTYTGPPGTTVVACPVIAGLPVMKGLGVVAKGEAAVVLAKGFEVLKSIVV